MISIREILEVNVNDLEQLNQLIPQLSGSAKLLTVGEFTKIVECSSTYLFCAEEDKIIQGMLSLVVFPIPTGVRAWIEDVVVKTESRGKGIGKLLTLHGISVANRLGASTVDLTSRPSREIANKLYQSLGFDIRSTNVYRHKFQR